MQSPTKEELQRHAAARLAAEKELGFTWLDALHFEQQHGTSEGRLARLRTLMQTLEKG